MRSVTDDFWPEEVLTKLMRSSLQATDARNGILLLRRAEHLHIEAIACAEFNQVTVNQAIPLSTLAAVTNDCLLLPISLIDKVSRTAVGVVLSDANGGHSYQRDPYIRVRKPRSILCVPLCKQDRLVGVLYLEDPVTQDAFDARDAEAVRVLGKRAVTCLEASGFAECV
ncbi:MAG: GAF domain-containing protein [Gammaproteobacteria bacterium]|nr:GAF domain-containing protein [Gammaproteobacteria bacterium]